MKKYIVGFVFAVALLAQATVLATLTSVTIKNSVINSTTIGATTPSTGTFTDLKIQGLTNFSGMQTMRNTSCTTAASAGASCNSTFTWPVSMGDTNYTFVCYLINSANDLATMDSGRQTSATQINVTIINTPGNSTATSGTVNCIGIHDSI